MMKAFLMSWKQRDDNMEELECVERPRKVWEMCRVMTVHSLLVPNSCKEVM